MTEQEIEQPEKSQNSAVVTMGYIFSFMPLLLIPIIFMPIAICLGLSCLFHNKAKHGVTIIVLALMCGFTGAYMGGWGLGLPKLELH
jgi:hypothetical protein